MVGRVDANKSYGEKAIQKMEIFRPLICGEMGGLFVLRNFRKREKLNDYADRQKWAKSGIICKRM